MKKQKRKLWWQKGVGLVISLAFGVGCGVLLARYSETVTKDQSLGGIFIQLGLLLFGMYLMLFLQIVIHEAGHLVFGLISGYRFSSFRIGSLMWVREQGRLQFKRMRIVGTGGQCLMAPPDLVDGKLPFVLYNLGGSLMNLISGLLFLGLYLLCKDIPYVSIFLLLAGGIGLFFALINGIPLRLGAVDNDGYNVRSMRKSPEALRAFWIQLKVNENIANGLVLKDMPDEWFVLPDDRDMKNSLVATIGVLAVSRLLDAQSFQEAHALMEHLLSADTGMAGLHRSLMLCDQIFYELIHENRREVLESMMDKQQKKFMKQMRAFPTVIRTEYAYALLVEKDEKQAEKLLKKFEKTALKYPHPQEIENERRLMEAIRQASAT